MDSKATATEPFVREPGAGSTLNVLGVTHIYKATGAETAGSFSLWEAVFPPGGGSPPHTKTDSTMMDRAPPSGVRFVILPPRADAQDGC